MAAAQGNHSSLLSNLALLSVDPTIPHPDPHASERERILWSALAKANTEIAELQSKIQRLIDMNLRYAEQLQSAIAEEPIRKRQRSDAQEAMAGIGSTAASAQTPAPVSSPQQQLGSSLYLPQKLRSSLNKQVSTQPTTGSGQLESEGNAGQSIYETIQTHGFQQLVVGAQDGLSDGTALQQMLHSNPQSAIPGSAAMSVMHHQSQAGAGGNNAGSSSSIVQERSALHHGEVGLSGAGSLAAAPANTMPSTVRSTTTPSALASQAAMAAAVAAVTRSSATLSIAANEPQRQHQQQRSLSASQLTVTSLSALAARLKPLQTSAAEMPTAPAAAVVGQQVQTQHQHQHQHQHQQQNQQQQQKQPRAKQRQLRSQSQGQSQGQAHRAQSHRASLTETGKQAGSVRTVTVDDIVVGNPEEIPSIGKFDSLRTLYMFKERAKEYDQLHGTQWREKMDSKRRQNWSRITAVYNRIVQLRGPGTSEADLERALQETSSDMAAQNMTLTRYSQLIRKKINDDRRSLAQQNHDPKEGGGSSQAQVRQQQQQQQQGFSAHSIQPVQPHMSPDF
ncbi:hypothetical protein GGI12_003246 [Dipsacomyces acuminosporus]|nr:hypothetical protein GGI12_003246 [Dipsacomyces acuminosporus]